jgi:nitric oxide reductase NorD protein
VLLRFVHGLSGRQLKLEKAEESYTDTETIFLPPVSARLDTPARQLPDLQGTVAFHWAQTRYGTFRDPLWGRLAETEHNERFAECFHRFESVRLEALLERELPGLYREIRRLRGLLGEASTRTGSR